jgi:uncharacterized protein
MRRKDRQVTSLESIKSIIEKCKVCHIAMVDNGAPYVVPMNFGYLFENNRLTLVFHSALDGRKIEILKTNPTVCFEMAIEGRLGLFENPCNSGYYYKSVIGFGEVEFINNIDQKCQALTILMKHQSGRDLIFTPEQAAGVVVFKITSTDYTGKTKPDPACHSA